LRILSAALFGIVTHAIKKLGPTVFLFVYIYLSHKQGEAPVNIAGYQVPAQAALISMVVLFSIISVAFRSGVLNKGKVLDARALPLLDHVVLARMHGFDMRLDGIRAKSVVILGALKNVALYVALAAMATANSPFLGLLICAVVLLVAAMTLRDWDTGMFARWPHIKPLLDAENLAEIILVIGLLIGFLLILPRGEAVLGGAIVLLVIARFSGQLKALAKQLIYLRQKYQAIRSAAPAAYRPIPVRPVRPPRAKV
jgi:hypothetical protein